MAHYDEDEFDAAARERGPVGVHRQLEPGWRRYLPYLVVIVVAPLLAWGVVSLLSNRTSPSGPSAGSSAPATTQSASPSESPTPTESASPSESPTPTESASPSESPTPEASESSDPGVSSEDRAQTVTILNGAGVSGLAANVAESLRGQGYTNVVTANYASNVPTSDTIYYNSAAQQAAAEEIGNQLGIGQIVQSSSATRSIAIVLRTNVLG